MWKLLPPTLHHNLARARVGRKLGTKQGVFCFCQKEPAFPPLPGGKISHCDRKILPPLPWCVEKLGHDRANATKRQQERKNWDSHFLIPMRSPTARKGRTTQSRCSLQRSKGAGRPTGCQLFWSRARWGLEPGGVDKAEQGALAGLTMTGLVAGPSLDGLAARSKNPSFWG